MLVLANNISQNIIEALGSMNLWIAICKSVFIILLGFMLTKVKIISDRAEEIIAKFVMVVSLPCLAFSSFMSTISPSELSSALFAFVYGFIAYFVFIFLAKLIFIGVKNKNRKKAMEILFVFGATTFFGQPLIQAVFPQAYNDSSMFNIAYRVLLYSYAYYVICLSDNKSDDNRYRINAKDLIKKVFCNPIIIATIIGFTLWTLQLIGDTNDPNNWYVVTIKGVDNISQTGAFWNIRISLPWLFQPIKTLGELASPLLWIVIGCTLGKVPLKEAAKDKMVWIYSFIKIIVGPAVNFFLLLFIKCITGLNLSFNIVAATTLMWAVPPSNVALTYCINSKLEATFASSCALITTFVAVIFIPVYIMLLTMIQNMGIFF